MASHRYRNMTFKCRECGNPVEQVFGKRTKLYYNAKCKKRWQRKQKKLATANREIVLDNLSWTIKSLNHIRTPQKSM